MAYIGKEFTFEREENFEAFIDAIGVSGEEKEKLTVFKPNQKLEKDGDTYKIIYILPEGTKETVFKNGETTEEVIREGLTAHNTFTVDGDTITQVQDFGDHGQITFTREYSENALKLSITSSKWDGVAHRWYTAV